MKDSRSAPTCSRPTSSRFRTGILIALFLIQKQGTGVVGRLFGPVSVAWFLALAVSGIWNIGKNPQVLQALNPIHAIGFVTSHGYASFLVLGSVLLALTGAEALYADMGHFGRRAIRLAWFGLVAPALVLNYFGQGALLIADPKAIENPFYLAFPAWALYPMVALGYGCDGDCLAGNHFRCLFDDATGDPTRLPAPHGGSTYLVKSGRDRSMSPW